jgi:hypothetical protein
MPNERNLAKLYESWFDEKLSRTQEIQLRNVLRRLEQPGAEASAALMKEIGTMDPAVRLLLLGALGVIPGGGGLSRVLGGGR